MFIFILFYFFCKLFFGGHCSDVDALFRIYHMTSLNYDTNGARDVGQIVSSV